MTHCVLCNAVIDPAHAFCPLCGADNRAPEDHASVGRHNHRFSSVDGHCILCGSKRPQVFGATHWPSVAIGVLVCCVGLALAVLTVKTIVDVKLGHNLDWAYAMAHGRKESNGELLHDCWTSGPLAVVLLGAGLAILVLGWRGFDMTNKDSFGGLWSK